MNYIKADIEVNVVGYGNWGSRLAKKLEQDGYIIKNLITNKNDIYVNCKNVLRRDGVDKVDKDLPTFILTGPLYHHDIIPLFNKKVFVEKPFYIKNNERIFYHNRPYINYLWHESTKIKKIAEIISNDFSYLDIDFFSANNVNRGLGIVEDFLPHGITFLRSLKLNNFDLISLKKTDQYKYQAHFISDCRDVKFNFGFSNRTYIKFSTDKKVVESSSYDSIIFNDEKILIQENLLSESIERYYKYYLTDDCELEFVSDDFHRLVYDLTYKLLK